MFIDFNPIIYYLRESRGNDEVMTSREVLYRDILFESTIILRLRNRADVKELL